jgi:hypothetical protein
VFLTVKSRRSSQFVDSHLSIVTALLAKICGGAPAVGSPKRDSTIVPHVGLSIATVIHSLSLKLPFFMFKSKI